MVQQRSLDPLYYSNGGNHYDH